MLQDLLTYSYDFALTAAAIWGTIAFIRHSALRVTCNRLCDRAAADVANAGREMDETVARLTGWQEPQAIENSPELDAVFPQCPDNITDSEPGQQQSTTPAIEMEDCIIPFRRKQRAIDWSALTPQELRQHCQANRIKWRNTHGKNKHLSKSQMIQALQQVQVA